jgi:3-hydroxyacyl-CoA dehydrogenase
MGAGTFIVDGEVGIITIDSPPVNALSVGVRRALDEGFRKFAADDSVEAIVLICAGRTFIAGADISELGKPIEQPDLQAVSDILENGPKPVIAAIHGTALGGGYEFALMCHYRIAVPSSKVGLPEVKLGLLPGGGGTQRLPRIVGPAAALNIIVGGDPVPAKKALELGMIDALAEEGRLREDAVAFARRILAAGEPLARVRDRQDKVEQARGNPELFADFRRVSARASRGFKAPENIIKAIEAAVDLPFDEGMAREAELFDELHESVESAAQRYYFFAERETVKVPDVPPAIPTREIKGAAVIGAGTMGAGIAMNFLNAGMPVTLVETNEEALARGLGVIRRKYENAAKRGRISAGQVEQRMALIAPTTELDAVSDADLVVETVYEEMALKKEVFEKLDPICKPSAILASNTSYLDLDEIAGATHRPESVIGLHFFSAANVIRLLEVVRGAKTDHEVIATALKLAKRIAKVPVLAKVCRGFIANRVMQRYMDQAEGMILEGTAPAAIDQAIFDYGFAMGPFGMADFDGLDVAGRGSNERTVRSDLVKLDRLGQKKNGGYYDYDADRTAKPSAVAAKVIEDVARYRGIQQRPPASPRQIVERLLYPVVNEGAKVLDEGIAIRASDVDVACILGFSWPIYTGGPMFWADTVGLPRILAKLKEHEALHGEAFRPARLLEEKVYSAGSFTRG